LNSRSLQAIVGLNDSFSVAALNQFRTNFGLTPININMPFGSNCIPNGCDQVESDLDVQYITSTGDGIPTIFINANPNLDGLASAFMYLDSLAEGSLPYAVSLSYGFYENDLYSLQNGYVSPVSSIEAVFMSLGIKGVSIFISSGDGGVSGDNVNSYTGNACELSPSWPATSPYVTAVGATQLVGSNSQTSWKEIVAQTPTGALINSGGGFSWGHSMPSWQGSAVAAWNKQGADPNIPSTAYFGNNRGIPDISLVGHSYDVYVDGTNGPEAADVDGTSCSSPALAGMISLINNELLNMGSNPIGPLNPILYQLYSSSNSIFNQVISGANPCLSARSRCCPSGSFNSVGFTVSNTWNPATGLGTPMFSGLMNGILQAATTGPSSNTPVSGSSNLPVSSSSMMSATLFIIFLLFV